MTKYSSENRARLPNEPPALRSWPRRRSRPRRRSASPLPGSRSIGPERGKDRATARGGGGVAGGMLDLVWLAWSEGRQEWPASRAPDGLPWIEAGRAGHSCGQRAVNGRLIPLGTCGARPRQAPRGKPLPANPRAHSRRPGRRSDVASAPIRPAAQAPTPRSRLHAPAELPMPPTRIPGHRDHGLAVRDIDRLQVAFGPLERVGAHHAAGA